MADYYYFYVPGRDIAPIGVDKKILDYDFHDIYDEAKHHYEVVLGYGSVDMLMTSDLNEAYKDVTLDTVLSHESSDY